MGRTLDDVRILDLTIGRGELAGRLLADLGAEVLKVEPPEGTTSRLLPPFAADGHSLYWECFGAGKHSVVIDLEVETGCAEYLELASHVDVVIESFKPGQTESRGIGYRALNSRNPSLIYAAITPFGQEGPKAHWPATDLTIEAAGGRVSIQGDTDRPPLPVGFPQAFLHAGAQAAADIVIALNEREDSGLGQFLDVSAQEAMWWTLMAAQGNPVCQNRDPPGYGDDRGSRRAGQGQRTVAAKDGLVTLAPGGSPTGTKTMFSFALEEAKQLGEPVSDLDQFDWDEWIPAYRSGVLSPQQMQSMSELLDAFVARRTKKELVEWALNNNLRLGPLNTTLDLLEFPQYLDRGFFKPIGSHWQPATWVHLPRTPLTHSGAPKLGESALNWGARRPKRKTDRKRSGNAFEGLKVADFSWVAAGPTVAKALADHGATVVKVESTTRPDLSRTLPPFVGEQPGLNRSYWSFLYGTSKLSLQCNLGVEEGRQLARKVCDWADVVLESFSPGTMERMGLDYRTLSKDREDLIMFSTSMLGQTGRYSKYAGFGQQASGFCGLHYITGWPDRDPCGVASPYTDVVAPKFGIASLAAAILERRRTGLGQHIDLAQAECSMLFIAPLILDQIVNNNTAERDGYHSTYACPQGIYRCDGIERYIAIAIESNDQWHSFCRVVPGFSFGVSRYDDFEARWEDREAISDEIDRWTRKIDAFELEDQLIAEDIPCSVVQRPMDVFRDPQMEAREVKQILTHSECGDVVHFGFCTRFSAKKQMVLRAPPCMGEHNDHVLRELLGLSHEEVSKYYESNAIT